MFYESQSDVYVFLGPDQILAPAGIALTAVSLPRSYLRYGF